MKTYPQLTGIKPNTTPLKVIDDGICIGATYSLTLLASFTSFLAQKAIGSYSFSVVGIPKAST